MSELQTTAVDLTDVNARADRDRLADRTDVIDRVGVLRALPDTFSSTTAMVAEFYQVDRETILTVVKRNRDELESDGFQVVARSEVTSILNVTPDDLAMPKTAPSLSMFPRRAVLRVGMLLRDSVPARQVRDYLLNAESRDRQLDPANLSRMQILELALDSERRAIAAESELEAHRPAIEYVETHVVITDDVMLVKDWGRTYGLTEPQAFALLRDTKDLIYPKTFEHWSRKRGRKVTETEYRPRAGKQSFTWFDVKEQRDAPRRNNGQARKTMYVKAVHAVDLARLTGLLPSVQVAV